ncbi:MAG: rhomboid family intramembrane serine protease [Desulfobacteraceae bacterium 4572_123]|nr:MAG: rhomboid family intramembrane serine protease [Desulfobacteraceae bacterium 4572_123]
MLPIRDTISSKNYPVVNTLIIAVNVAVYLMQKTYGADIDRFIYIYGLVPARYSLPQIAAYFTVGQQFFSLISFMFLHGGFWHLLGNMWSLYIFGDNVEDRLGPLRYLLFYLLCGLASGLSHLILNLHSKVPTIGASGAIAGVMGAYFILYPRSKILTLIPIIIIPWFVEIPAFFFLGLWFMMQFINAAGSHLHGGGIAWWAHIGGFVFGIVFLYLMEKIPNSGATHKVQKVTARHGTHRLQVIRPTGGGESPHLRGTLNISAQEALKGTRKLVNIPWGFQKRLFNVVVPSGIRTGSILRLKGMGKQMPGGRRGDLLLKVTIQH